MNVHSTHRPLPRMTEAFEHPAGSIAVNKAGGATQWRGKLLHIHVAPSASYEMEERQEAECVAGRGIVGDRYYQGTGTYSPKPDVREVTLSNRRRSMRFRATIRRCRTDRSPLSHATTGGI